MEKSYQPEHKDSVKKSGRRCIFFARGNCKYKDACKYKHVVPECRNFTKNIKCGYGEKCRFRCYKDQQGPDKEYIQHTMKENECSFSGQRADGKTEEVLKTCQTENEMEHTIINMLPELQDRIFSYLTQSDLVSFARTCKDAYALTKHLLFQHLHVTSANIVDSETLGIVLKNIKAAWSLTISKIVKPEYYWSDSIYDKLPSTFFTLLTNCDARRLITLHINRFNMVVHMMKNIILLLNALQELTLENTFMEEESWTALGDSTSLKKLVIRSCNFSPNAVASILKLKNLNYLELDNFGIERDVEVSLEEICRLSSLRKLSINCDSMVLYFEPDSYLHLAKLVNLNKLEMECAMIEDDALVNISYYLVNLTALIMNSCREFTDNGLRCLHLLKSLRRVDMTYSIKMTTLGVSYICKVLLLEHINLSGCLHLRDDCLVYLESLKYLKRIDLSYTHIEEMKMTHICQVVSLEELDLSQCFFSSGSIVDSQLPASLNKLNVSCSEITCLGISNIAKMRSLTALNISECESLDGSDLIHLQLLKSLKDLNVSSVSITQEGVLSICKMLSLESLDLSACRIKVGNNFKHLPMLKRLKKLDISYNSMTAIGISYIYKVKLLEDLSISGCSKVADDTLKHIYLVKFLARLDVSNTAITDLGLSYISKVLSLRYLDLSCCRKLDNDSLTYLRELKCLKKLKVGCKGITEAGTYAFEMC